jgi:PTH1 family peptidyl-tRNA hydrolase
MLVDGLLIQARDKGGGAEKLSAPRQKFELWKAWLAPLPSLPWLLLKPLTYMNLSGEAVRQVLAYYQLKPNDLLVAHDEMDLPLGRMRFKLGGGAAGHKGVLSIEQALGSGDFYRLRLGIGKKNTHDAVSYVTSSFAPGEQSVLEEVLQAACSFLPCFVETDFEEMRRRINSFRPASRQETPATN